MKQFSLFASTMVVSYLSYVEKDSFHRYMGLGPNIETTVCANTCPNMVISPKTVKKPKI